jgi:SAM-dependent methyltransferase
MDEAHPDPARLGNEFRFLVKFNAATGSGTAIVDTLVRRMAPARGQQVSVVDFGAGVGDIARSFITRAGRRGWVAHCVATDRNPLVVDMARGHGSMDGLSFAVVDVLQAEAVLGAKSFDAAHASLMLHHLPDEEVVGALKSMSRVARHAVIWNDLIHDGFGIAGAWFATLTSPAETRRDAMLSVKNGFSMRQAVEFAEAAGLRDIRVRRWRGPRFLLTARPAE